MAIKSRQIEGFSLARMRDVFNDCTDKLTNAISKQGVDFNPDDFEGELRSLIVRFGHGRSSAILSPDYYTGASAESTPIDGIDTVEQPKPNYNLAADCVVSAYDLYSEGNTREAIQMLANALEADGIQELVAALNETNNNTDLAILASLGEVSEPTLDESGEVDSSTEEETISDFSDSHIDGEPEEEIDPELIDDSSLHDDETSHLTEEEIDSIPAIDHEGSEETEETEGDIPVEPSSDEELDEIVSSVAANVTPFKKPVLAHDSKPAAKAPPTAQERAFLNKISLSGDKKYRSLAMSMR